jgi:hypothetical protein
MLVFKTKYVGSIPTSLVFPIQRICFYKILALNTHKQNGVIVIRGAHDPKMLVRFQLLLTLVFIWQILQPYLVILFTIITGMVGNYSSAVEHPFVIRKVSGSTPLNYPKGII